MAKRKGKSQHRQKDWERLRRTETQRSEDAASFRRLTQRKVRLPGQAQDEAMLAPMDPAQFAASGLQSPGVVAQLYPGGAVVRTQAYGDLLCGLAGTFRPVPNASALAVGDLVTVELSEAARQLVGQGTIQLDLARVDGQILQRAQRRTVLSRPQPMSAKRRGQWWDAETFEKVIAANMDQLVVVAAVADPPLRARLLDRYLIIAQRGELPCRLVINKIDLGPPDEELLRQYAELGMPSIRCSAATGAGLEDLRGLLKDKASVLAGASGVGKSSLLNALVPGMDLPTRQVRQSDARGRHTTSAATLYALPFGGTVVDTPGVRELGMEMDRNLLPWYFPEFAPLAAQCRFRDCTHTHEPACAVRDAAEAGQIAPWRYESYLRILEDLES